MAYCAWCVFGRGHALSSYAARIVEHEGQLQILGFEDRGRDQFVGQIMDPEPVVVNPDGTLYIPTSKGQAT